MKAADHPTMLSVTLPDGKVECSLCNQRCVLEEGKWGVCGVRQVRSGRLRTIVYGRAAALGVDPIEKKPLFHFHPGTGSFSIATIGCNFRCRFCQNHHISQVRKTVGDAAFVPPSEVVRIALERRCRTIAFTYTEPTIFGEYARDIGKLAHEKGIGNVFVTNGYMTPEALEEFSSFLDAANVDLKAFDDDTYRTMIGGRLEPVLETLRLMRHRYGIWVEVTTLVVPGMNDSDHELRRIATFIAEDLGPEVPWHVSRFHPDHRVLDRAATPPDTLAQARRIGLDCGLRYVFTGNIPGDEGEHTFCPGCGKVVIERWGFAILRNDLDDGHCPHCRTAIDGVGM